MIRYAVTVAVLGAILFLVTLTVILAVTLGMAALEAIR